MRDALAGCAGAGRGGVKAIAYDHAQMTMHRGRVVGQRRSAFLRLEVDRMVK
jgi:hypothetical protein